MNTPPETPLKRCSRDVECAHVDGPLLPATREYFHKRGNGLMAQCKECRKRYHHNRRDEILIEMRARYYLNRDQIRAEARDRYASDPEFRRATAERNRKERLEHPEKDRERTRIRRLIKGREKDPRSAERSRQTWSESKDEKNAKRRTDESRSYKRLMHILRPESQKRGKLVRRARKASLPDTFSREDYAFCMNYWGNKCAITGEAENLELDHWIPISSSDCPGTVAQNIIPLVSRLNRQKWNKAPAVWLFESFPEEQAREILERVQAYFDLVRKSP